MDLQRARLITLTKNQPWGGIAIEQVREASAHYQNAHVT